MKVIALLLVLLPALVSAQTNVTNATNVTHIVENWSIEYLNATIGFGDTFEDNEVTLFYKIDDKPYIFTLFEGKDCNVTVDPSVINVTTSVFSANHLEAWLDIDPTLLDANPGLWSDNSTLCICARVDLIVEADLLGSGDNYTSVNFLETIFKIEIDFSLGFTIMGVIEVLEDSPTLVGPLEAAILYNVTACHCDPATWICYNSTTAPILSQSDALVVCITTGSDEINLTGVDTLTVAQGALKYSPIFDGGEFVGDDLVAVDIVDVTKIVVTVELLSGFFSDVASTIAVTGIVIFSFLTGRRLAQEGTLDVGRLLQNAIEDNAAQFDIEGIRTLNEQPAADQTMSSGPSSEGGDDNSIVIIAAACGAAFVVVGGIFFLVLRRRSRRVKEDEVASDSFIKGGESNM